MTSASRIALMTSPSRIALTAEYNATCTTEIETIIQRGLVIIKARRELPHGEAVQWVEEAGNAAER